MRRRDRPQGGAPDRLSVCGRPRQGSQLVSHLAALQGVEEPQRCGDRLVSPEREGPLEPGRGSEPVTQGLGDRDDLSALRGE